MLNQQIHQLVSIDQPDSWESSFICNILCGRLEIGSGDKCPLSMNWDGASQGFDCVSGNALTKLVSFGLNEDLDLGKVVGV